jgi:hypothetical protein
MYFQNGLQHSGVEYLFITFPKVGVAEYLKYLFSDGSFCGDLIGLNPPRPNRSFAFAHSH